MLGKLRGRSLGELRVRGLQAAHALAERAGVGTAAPRRVPAAVALPAVADPAWDAAIAARWPEHVETVVARAERVLRGEYDLLGFDGLAAGMPPDWHRDPDSGRRAPDGHWSRVPFLDASLVGDHKVTWELNRHQYLVTLAQAWRLTRDARYAAGVATLLDDWMRANPPTRGMNWASALEVAFRAIAWTWALRLLHDAPAPDAALRQRAAGTLHVHGRHLERYLSTYFSPNTHLTGEALGLLYLGVACPGLSRAARWRARGSEILRAEAARQIRADGTYFEQTTWYQHYTVEFYLHAQWLWEAVHVPVPDAVRARAERAADVLAAVLRPDGSIPLFGDDDGGRTLPLDGRRPGDFRDTLAVAAVRYDRADLARRAGALPPGAAWLLGPDGTARYDALLASAHEGDARAPRAVEALGFPDGGLYVLRDGADPHASLLVLDAGRHGELTSGHSHADALAFDLTVDGRPVLVDAGTHRYVGPTRDAFRSAASHNTASVDGRSAAEPSGAFRWASVAHAHARAFAPLPWGGALAAEVTGWPHRAGGARHRRAALWRAGAYWLLVDEIATAGRAEVALHFQAAAGLDVVTNVAGAWRLVAADGAEMLRAQMVPLGPVAATLEACEGRVSRSYGASEPAATLRWRATVDDRVVLATLLVPGGAPTPVLRADADGTGWTIDVGGERHHVRADAPLAHGPLALDGALAWTRSPGADALPDECVVLAPTGGTLDGRPIAPGGWLHALRTPDGWHATAGS